jgi:hypothetical protein
MAVFWDVPRVMEAVSSSEMSVVSIYHYATSQKIATFILVNARTRNLITVILFMKHLVILSVGQTIHSIE